MRCVKPQENNMDPVARENFEAWGQWRRVLFTSRGGGADISNRDVVREDGRKGGLTLVKVRDTCLLPQIVTQAATALTSS